MGNPWAFFFGRSFQRKPFEFTQISLECQVLRVSINENTIWEYKIRKDSSSYSFEYHIFRGIRIQLLAIFMPVLRRMAHHRYLLGKAGSLPRTCSMLLMGIAATKSSNISDKCGFSQDKCRFQWTYSIEMGNCPLPCLITGGQKKLKEVFLFQDVLVLSTCVDLRW